MNLFSLMRNFTIRFRMLGAIGVVLGLLGLGLLSAVYFMTESILPRPQLAWVVVVISLGAEIGAARWLGSESAGFLAINNLIQVVAVVGVANLWAQSGLKARDAAILGAALLGYDFLFTAVLPFMNDLFNHVAGLPFAPLVAWPTGSGDPSRPWLAIGLGDLLLSDGNGFCAVALHGCAL